MRSSQILVGLLLVVGTGVIAGHGLSRGSKQRTSGAGGASSQASGGTLPKDVYADTGNRLPLVKREELDENGKKLYDLRAQGPGSGYGPGGIRLYSPTVADNLGRVNDYLRHKSGLDPQVVELAILATARELDCQFVWTDHEPAALQAGLQQQTIDIVKYRKPLTGLEEKDAVIIQLGRELIGKHQVSSSTAARALKLFGNQGLVNVVSLMGDYASTALLLNAFDQHVRPTAKPLLPMP
jgi:4-carboxymuconolactone decarboxylase